MATARTNAGLGVGLLLAGLLVSVTGLAWAWLAGGWGASGTWSTWAGLPRVALVGSGLVVAAVGTWLYLRGLTSGHLTPATFLDPVEEERVLEAIRQFENRTSGEIRVHLADRVKGDILVEARNVFEEIGMTDTAEHNGVLFFVAVPSRRFAVLGDKGIDERVPEGFWNECVERVRTRLADGRYADGLIEGIEMAGEALAEFFPPRPDDVNELPDTISRG